MARPEIEAHTDWMIGVRREIHQRPELGYQEVETSALAARTLGELGLEVKTGVGGTGVVGLWHSGRPGPMVGMRADMDALPVTESGDHPWKSCVPGVMHACGHDVHTAMLLGLARFLAQTPAFGEGLGGGVKLIFQPAEEGGGGAAAMIRDGVLEDPPLEAVFAMHVAPPLEVGVIGYKYGVALAAVDIFSITIRGRGGHAAHPELALDPVAPAAELVRRLKQKAGTIDQALLAVTMLQAGTQNNIIPDIARIAGTIRSLDPDRRQEILTVVPMVCREIERETGLNISPVIEAGYPMLVNDDRMVDLVVDTAQDLFGSDNVLPQGPSFGAEDMAYFLQRVPGSHIWLGCGRPHIADPPMLHSPEFDPDEGCMTIGLELMTGLVRRILAGKTG